MKPGDKGRAGNGALVHVVRRLIGPTGLGQRGKEYMVEWRCGNSTTHATLNVDFAGAQLCHRCGL